METILIVSSLFLFASLAASKISDRLGVPALLLFLTLGMLAGSDGPGGLYFDDAVLTQFLGLIALLFILFSGGLDTNWGLIRPVLVEGLVLATIGVFITALLAGLAVYFFVGLSFWEAILVGAIVSSTDAAAVLAILRSQNLHLKKNLQPLLELESGSNDPLAVLLTVTIIQIITLPSLSWAELGVTFVAQFVVGGLWGYGLGQLTVILLNRFKLGYDGLYPVLTIACVLFIYSFTTVCGGNGFLAIYIAGIVIGNQPVLHKKSLLQFHDGLAWLMQIGMFLVLGLLVFPSQLPGVVGVGLITAFFLVFVARPVSIFATLWYTPRDWREKLFLSWVGLRGAVPIILATYPLLAGVQNANLIFNLVFFVVLTSVLLQGTTVKWMAQTLGLGEPAKPKRLYPLEYTPMGELTNELTELPVVNGSPAVGKAIFELGLPPRLLVVLIARQNEFVVPTGATVLEEQDVLLVFAEPPMLKEVQSTIFAPPIQEKS